MRTYPLLQLPSPLHGSGPILLSPFSPSSVFHPIQLHGDLSFPFWCLTSSASVQLVCYENCSIRRCFLDMLWREMNSNSSYSSPILCLSASIFLKISSCMLPGEFHGQRRLVGYSPWSHKVSDVAEQLMLSLWFLQCSLFSSILFSLQVFVFLQILFFL